MNAEYLPFVLPFIASLLAVFLGPIIAAKLQRQRDGLPKTMGHSSMLDNYSGALESAWKRINILEQHLERLEKERDTSLSLLTAENRKLKILVYDLEQEVERLSSLSYITPRKEHDDRT